MDTPRKNNDCYFYYYSTCLKGDGCTFRHEPAALGSETVCSYWAQGKCLSQPCNFRHMELKKNRKTIPCYWETQPSGCQKSHCSFQHKSPRDHVQRETDQSNNCDAVGAVKPDSPNYPQRRSVPGDGAESSEGDASRPRLNQEYNTTPVDPMVVNFEEESDNESVPASSPIKHRVKTQEELHLERIQAESAAYYSYNMSALSTSDPGSDDFHVMTLAEIRAKSQKNGASKSDFNEPKNRSYKRRAHSPIRFDILQAEPSVGSRRLVLGRTKRCKLSGDDASGETKVKSRVLQLKTATISNRPIKLRRPCLEAPSTNGSKVLAAEGVTLIERLTELASEERKQEPEFFNLPSTEPDVITSRISKDLMQVNEGEVPSHAVAISNGAVYGGKVTRDESMDEDMLLESSTINPDDDVLPDDIDAFLDD